MRTRRTGELVLIASTTDQEMVMTGPDGLVAAEIDAASVDIDQVMTNGDRKAGTEAAAAVIKTEKRV